MLYLIERGMVMKENELEKAMKLFGEARIMDKKRCVQDIIKIIDDKKAYTFIEPKSLGNNLTEFGYYKHNERLYDLTKIIENDQNYRENFKQIAEKDISTFTMQDISTCITWIFRGDYYGFGTIADAVDNGKLKDLLTRYLELYQEECRKQMKKELQEQATLRKTMIGNDGKEYEVEEILEKMEIRDDEKSLREKLRKK